MPNSSRNVRRADLPGRSRSGQAAQGGFTLTELLIVIAIIAILAGLAATAAINAMNAARRASISLELKQLGGAMDNLKNDLGAYPPNGMNPDPLNTNNGSTARLVQADFESMFKRAFPKHQESPALIRALCGQNSGGVNLPNGLTAAEALYFWLGGFSDDELYPISGPRGPSFQVVNDDPSDEVIEDRARKYEFDLTRLRPINANSELDWDQVRFIVYPDPKNPNQDRRINFWRYHPSGSEQPIVYFDVSRHKPGLPNVAGRYDAWAANPDNGAPRIYAIKQARKGMNAQTLANSTFAKADVLFVEQGKCQVLHAGLDDAWGEEFGIMGCSQVSQPADLILYPQGPFLKETSDTLANFLDGTLGDAQEANQ